MFFTIYIVSQIELFCLIYILIMDNYVKMSNVNRFDESTSRRSVILNGILLNRGFMFTATGNKINS